MNTLAGLEENIPSRADNNDTDGVLANVPADISSCDGGIHTDKASVVAKALVVHGLFAGVIGFNLIETKVFHEGVKLTLCDLNEVAHSLNSLRLEAQRLNHPPEAQMPQLEYHQGCPSLER